MSITLLTSRLHALAALAIAECGQLTNAQLVKRLDAHMEPKEYAFMIDEEGPDDAFVANVLDLDLES